MKRSIKILTILTAWSVASALFAAVASQEQFKTHLRFNVFTPASQMAVSKNGKIVTLSTLGQDLFEALTEEVNKYHWPSAYISKVNVIPGNTESAAARRIEFVLANDQVELFSFYRDSDQKYVLDFWLEADNHAEKEDKESGENIATNDAAAEDNPGPSPVRLSAEAGESNNALVAANGLGASFGTTSTTTSSSSSVSLAEEAVGKTEDQVGLVAAAVQKDKKKTSSTLAAQDNDDVWQNVINKRLKKEEANPYRDFRYGASFIWDYDALSPTPPEMINLADKTPEFFYPVVDRNYNKDDRESHLQLIINLYRQEKWGLMHKAMKLFTEKYGPGEVDLMDYLKANALLRDNIVKKDPAPIKMAVNIYKSIYERTSNYELAQALVKYMIAYYLSQDALVDT